MLILITIILVVIISGFAIGFVRDKLSESDCIDILGEVKFTNNVKYTCYDEDESTIKVQVHIGDKIKEISGFTISTVSASSQSYEVKNNTDETSIIMFDPLEAPLVDKLIIPGKNSERTYNLTSVSEKPDAIKIYPILKDGKTCNPSDTIEFIADCPA
jgi:hypothetical protein